MSSQAIQRYRRPALELYGSSGTANLLGDDCDPRRFEVWRNEDGFWKEHDAIEPTWLWANGLREVLACISEGCQPFASLDHDLHLLHVIDAAQASVAERAAIAVDSSFARLDLRFEGPDHLGLLHDHTRPSDEQ